MNCPPVATARMEERKKQTAGSVVVLGLTKDHVIKAVHDVERRALARRLAVTSVCLQH